MDKQYLPELIAGKRISLRRHNVGLAQKMFEYVTEDQERLSRFLPWPKFINKVEDEIDFINKCNDSWDKYESAHYGIFRNEDNEYMMKITSTWETFLHLFSIGQMKVVKLDTGF